jgi:outer membrane protein
VSKSKLVAALGALAVMGAPVGAQAPAPTKVGVIQIQSAIVSTKDGQAAAKDLEERFQPKRRELEKRQGEIRAEQERLQKGANTMPQAAKDELARKIDSLTKAFNRDAEDAQAELEQEQNKMLNELGQKMMVVIDKYAKDNGYAVILDVSNPQTPVLYASNTVDITKDIIDLYDKNTPATPPAGVKPMPAPVKPATPAPTKK